MILSALRSGGTLIGAIDLLVVTEIRNSHQQKGRLSQTREPSPLLFEGLISAAGQRTRAQHGTTAAADQRRAGSRQQATSS